MARKTAEKTESYAVLALGSKQQLVRVGDIVRVEKLTAEAGKKLQLDQVLCVKSGKTFKVGQPHVQGASVEASVVDSIKGPKLSVFYKRRRKHSRKKIGHRQLYTLVQIDAIKD